jgi:hypothetical protein
MKRLEKCEQLINAMNLKLEPAGKKHDYEAAIEGLPTPKFVVKHQNPSYDIKWFLNASDLLEWLQEAKHEYDQKGFITGI